MNHLENETSERLDSVGQKENNVSASLYSQNTPVFSC